MSTKTETTTAVRCWELRWGTAEDEVSHFPTREKAEQHRSAFVYVPAGLTQLERDCHVITCPTLGCGYRFDEDGDGVNHFESSEEAVRWVLLCDWADSENGPVCQGCVEDGHYTP